MTNQLHLLSPDSPSTHRSIGPHRRISESTRKIGRAGLAEARAALDEANRIKAQRQQDSGTKYAQARQAA